MSGVRNILYPVDFSEQSVAILPLVKAMAKQFDADVTLLHALEIPPIFSAGRCAAEDELAVFYDGPVETVVETGDPATVIVNYAAKHQVDLIMLATHGYGGFCGRLLGSVAAKVLHDAKCPVWTAAHTEEPTLQSHSDFRSMMCAVDLEAGSSELWERAAKLSANCSARLRLVHAVPDAGEGVDMFLAAKPHRDVQNRLLGAAREEAARMQQKVGTKLDQCVAGGEVSEVVRGAAEHHEADLVIIGRGKLRTALDRLRTHAYSIIRDCPCPVLSL
jgi:nucleotide-binding universal stress UspA family protein